MALYIRLNTSITYPFFLIKLFSFPYLKSFNDIAVKFNKDIANGNLFYFNIFLIKRISSKQNYTN